MPSLPLASPPHLPSPHLPSAASSWYPATISCISNGLACASVAVTAAPDATTAPKVKAMEFFFKLFML
ncbi:hypothetical protein CWC13_09025 [Pseudoalteromonas ruthenica]|nr:hypothetical protein CWC13_09025 [Pseudoalteromonas ruthenica]